jgi:predicted RNA binding protein YcfA (HicA-like mRNA interferase family)
VLTQHGFVEIDQAGSHKKFRFNSLVVIVPAAKREIPYGTFMSIIRQSCLTKQDFE